MEKSEQITNHPTMKAVLADSCGGLIYNVANQNKYDGTDKDELLSIWDTMSVNEQNVMGGIIKGAIDFLKGK